MQIKKKKTILLFNMKDFRIHSASQNAMKATFTGSSPVMTIGDVA
jgi:hypothetical protein